MYSCCNFIALFCGITLFARLLIEKKTLFFFFSFLHMYCFSVFWIIFFHLYTVNIYIYRARFLRCSSSVPEEISLIVNALNHLSYILLIRGVNDERASHASEVASTVVHQ